MIDNIAKARMIVAHWSGLGQIGDQKCQKVQNDCTQGTAWIAEVTHQN